MLARVATTPLLERGRGEDRLERRARLVGVGDGAVADAVAPALGSRPSPDRSGRRSGTFASARTSPVAGSSTIAGAAAALRGARRRRASSRSVTVLDARVERQLDARALGGACLHAVGEHLAAARVAVDLDVLRLAADRARRGGARGPRGPASRRRRSRGRARRARRADRSAAPRATWPTPADSSAATASASRGSAWRFSQTNGWRALSLGAHRRAAACRARFASAGSRASCAGELARPEVDRRHVDGQRERVAVAVDDRRRDAARASPAGGAGAPPAARKLAARGARSGRRRARRASANSDGEHARDQRACRAAARCGALTAGRRPGPCGAPPCRAAGARARRCDADRAASPARPRARAARARAGAASVARAESW